MSRDCLTGSVVRVKTLCKKYVNIWTHCIENLCKYIEIFIVCITENKCRKQCEEIIYEVNNEKTRVNESSTRQTGTEFGRCRSVGCGEAGARHIVAGYAYFSGSV